MGVVAFGHGVSPWFEVTQFAVRTAARFQRGGLATAKQKRGCVKGRMCAPRRLVIGGDFGKPRAAMLNALRQKLLAVAQSAMRETTCPHCQHRFQPFADRPAKSFADLNQLTCPKCGKSFTFADTTGGKGATDLTPEGPFEQPPGSRIERRPVSASELLFYIPASGRWGGLLFFAIFWNAISWTVFLAFVFAKSHVEGDQPPFFVIGIFPAVGLGLAYAAIRMRFATHLIFLGPEFVRLQRALVRRKNYDLPTAEIVHVKKAEFYKQNYQPVYGIEIGAGKRRIRFGSALSEEEKNWLCWEMRTFLREQGAPL